MVTISSDGSTVTTSSDFTALQAQYSAVSFINSPAQSGAPAATYPACPATSTAFNASTTLPPTPNDAACSCLENNLSCQFTPLTTNYSVIVGELLDEACSFLGQAGGSCNDIAGDGSTGIYGRISGCDPSTSLILFYFILFAFSQYFFFSDTKLSYVMSEFYEDTNKNPQSCNFGGNATLNRVIPSASATAAASSCIANPSATFTPSAPTTSGGSSSSSGGGSGGSGTRSGSVSLTGGLDVVVGMGVMAIVGVMGAVWTLV